MSEIQWRDDEPSSPALDAIRRRTPARLFMGRAGAAYRTLTQLELRADHAGAVDAVRRELDLEADLGPALVEALGLFEIRTRARSKAEYLARPDLGRSLDPAAAEILRDRCPRGATVQFVVGDGLSATAVARQVPTLLPLLVAGSTTRGWSVGRPFVARYCRVGLLNEIGDTLDPTVVVLLVGERPGLATAESLSAYMAHRPRSGHTDAHRNLVSNIHARGLTPEDAAHAILETVSAMLEQATSGVGLRLEAPRAELPDAESR